MRDETADLVGDAEAVVIGLCVLLQGMDAQFLVFSDESTIYEYLLWEPDGLDLRHVQVSR
jgi:hypothetical protein